MADIYLSNRPAGTYGGLTWGSASDGNDGLSASSPYMTANTALVAYQDNAQDGDTLYINDGEYTYTASDGRYILQHASSNIQPMSDFGTTLVFDGSNAQGLRYNYTASEARLNTLGKIVIKASHEKDYSIYLSGNNTSLNNSIFNCAARLVPTNTNQADFSTRYGILDAVGSIELNITGGGVSAADGSLIDISSENYEFRPLFKSSSAQFNPSVPCKINITSWTLNLKAKLANGRGVIDIRSDNAYPSGSSVDVSGVTGTVIAANSSASMLWLMKLENPPSNSTVSNNTVSFSALNGSGAGGIWVLGKLFDTLNNSINGNDITLSTDSGSGFGILLGGEGVASDFSNISGDIFNNTITGSSTGGSINGIHGLNHIHAEGERYNNTVTGVAIGSLTKASGAESRNNTITIDPVSNSKTHLYAKGAYVGASFTDETLISTSDFTGNFIQSLFDDTTGGADVYSDNVTFSDITITGDMNTNSKVFSVGYTAGDNSSAVISNVTLPEGAPTLNTYGRSSLTNYTNLTDLNNLSWVTGVIVATGEDTGGDGDGGDGGDDTPAVVTGSRAFDLSQWKVTNYYTAAEVDAAIQDALDGL